MYIQSIYILYWTQKRKEIPLFLYKAAVVVRYKCNVFHATISRLHFGTVARPALTV